MNWELLDVQAGLRKGRGTRDHIANICWIMEKEREFQKNKYFCFIDNAKPFDCVAHDQLWKILIDMGVPKHLTCLLRNLYGGQEAIVITRHGKLAGSTLRKEYYKAVYCHPAYLTYMQSTSCERLGWINCKLESRLPGEISTTSVMQLCQTLRDLTRLLCPWNSWSKNTGVGSHSFLQGISLTQGLNPGLLHCRQILYCLNHQGSSTNSIGMSVSRLW